MVPKGVIHRGYPRVSLINASHELGKMISQKAMERIREEILTYIHPLQGWMFLLRRPLLPIVHKEGSLDSWGQAKRKTVGRRAPPD